MDGENWREEHETAGPLAPTVIKKTGRGGIGEVGSDAAQLALSFFI